MIFPNPNRLLAKNWFEDLTKTTRMGDMLIDFVPVHQGTP